MRPNPDQVGEGALVVPIEHGTTPPSLRFGAPWRGACRDVGLRRAQSSRLTKSGRLIREAKLSYSLENHSHEKRVSRPGSSNRCLETGSLSQFPPKLVARGSRQLQCPPLDWMGARVVDWARLESVCTARYRGFESLPIRQRYICCLK